MDYKNLDPIEARKRRLLREMPGSSSEPQGSLVDLIAVLAIIVIGAAAVLEARHGSADARSVPIARGAMAQPVSLTPAPVPPADAKGAQSR